jgi:hypothetical protein
VNSLEIVVGETAFYMIIAGAIQAVLTVVFVLAISPVILIPRRPSYWGPIWRVCLFSAVLLVVGAGGNLLWYVVAVDRLYTNFDPILEFFPFAIPGEWTLDTMCGGRLLNGHTMAHLRLAWAAIAFLVWAASVVVYRFIMARIRSGVFAGFLSRMLGFGKASRAGV